MSFSQEVRKLFSIRKLPVRRKGEKNDDNLHNSKFIVLFVYFSVKYGRINPSTVLTITIASLESVQLRRNIILLRT